MAHISVVVTGTSDADTVLEVLEQYAVRRMGKPQAEIDFAARSRVHGEATVMDQLAPRVLATRIAQAVDEDIMISLARTVTHQYGTEQLNVDT